ncbi:hypothetical protein GCM10009039_34130 [Halocalculus aciditolerans]|uniref:histidine kinase n=2 Tax=Halocalculus aciditolerans TaxID=1383812 RepID=A0A830FR47_9EURY|nr:hypothetical protein GCM10009039_34130 [Halocalculus aciditolerans]
MGGSVGGACPDGVTRDAALGHVRAATELLDGESYHLDGDGRVIAVNERALDTLGRREASVVGEQLSAFLGDGDGRRLRDALADESRGEETLRVTMEAASGDVERDLRVVGVAGGEASETAGAVVVGESVESTATQCGGERGRDVTLAKYETIAETIDDGIYVVDAEDRYTMVNDAFASMTGYDRETLLGSHASRVVTEDTIEEGRALRESMADDETANATLETTIEVADGEEIPVEATFATISTGEGEERVGVVRDISQRLEQRRKVEESERRYRTLVEHFPNGAVAMFDEDLRYTAAGGQLLDEAGVDPADRVGMRVTDLYPPDVVEAVEEHFYKALNGEASTFEVTYAGHDMFDQVLPVRDADGNVTSGMLVVQDVTERREYQRDLERRARQQAVVAELGQTALETDDLDALMADAAHAVADVLDTDYCKVLDLDEESRELLLRQGVGWDDGIVQEAAVDADENSQAGYTLLSEEPVVVDDLDAETRFDGPDLLVDHDVTSGVSTIIGSVDDPWGILGTHDTDAQEFTEEDVNFVQSVANVLANAIERERYNAELETLVDELEESNHRLEQFAYAASHDLQEPLRMVSSYLSLIESRYEDELDEDGEEFLAFAVDGAERMREMIDALLRYSRVETRGDAFEPVDLDGVFADVRADLGMRIEESDADVTAETLPRVEGDEDQLRQVFQNLLDNALEYNDDAPTVRVSSRREGEMWRLAVRDDGIGIDPERADSVFEVFQRLHTRDEHEGTGIGLALCQRIVERHGGEITVDSTPGEGSTFEFTLPAAGAEVADE